MPSLNRFTIIGHLGAEPELRRTQSGSAVLNMRVATTEKWKDRSEQWQEVTEWWNVTLWNEQAERLAEFLHKGSMIYCEGPLRSRKFEGKDGVERTSMEIKAGVCFCLDKKPVEHSGPRTNRGVVPPPPRGYGKSPPSRDPAPVDDSDIPF